MAEWKNFERSWRDWLGRPPRRSKAEAARRVLDGIAARPPRRVPLRPVLAAAAVVMVAAVVLLNLRSRPAPPAAAHGEVVMIMLDASTPLYMNLEPLDLGQGGGS